MTPEQLQSLIAVLRETGGQHGSSFNWIQGAMALGATLVSVTGVVVGMRGAIAALGKQLDVQGVKLDKLTDNVAELAKEVAVLKYAQGISEDIPHARNMQKEE